MPVDSVTGWLIYAMIAHRIDLKVLGEKQKQEKVSKSKAGFGESGIFAFTAPIFFLYAVFCDQS